MSEKLVGSRYLKTWRTVRQDKLDFSVFFFLRDSKIILRYFCNVINIEILL